MVSAPTIKAQARDAGADPFCTPPRFALALGLAILAVFPKVALGIETFFYRDFGVLAYPSIFYHHESFWRGELPLWNPLSNCGAPFLAQWGTMTLYPFSLLYLLFPLPWSVNFFCLAHLFWAGLGTYVLASRWTGNRFAASVAGFAFVFNGVTFSCLLWPNYVVALGWMPWVITAVERSWREGGRWLIGAALASALQVLSGVPEVVILTWALLSMLLLLAFAEGAISRALLVGRTAAVVLLVAGLTAAQLWPFWDLLQHSQRDRSFATAKWSMPVSGLANLLVPLFHSFHTPQGIFFQVGQQFFSSTYLGIGVLALAAYALVFGRNNTVWVLSALTIFSLAFAIGENGFFYRGLKQLFPLMGFARYPIKFIILATLAVPLLAAYAIRYLDTLADRGEHKCARGLIAIWLSIMILIMALLSWERLNPFPSDQWSALLLNGSSRAALLSAFLLLLLWRVSRARAARRVASWLILTLIVLDTLSHTPHQNPTLPSSAVLPGLWEAAYHLSPPKPGESRVMITPLAEEVLLKSGVESFDRDFLGRRLALWSHLNLLEGIAKVNGSSTLQVREQVQVQSLLYASTNAHLPRLLDFLGASYISSESNAVAWVPRTNYLPMITIGQQPIFVGAEATIATLTNSNLDLRHVVYLPVEAGRVVQASGASLATIRSYQFSPQRIQVEVESPQPAMLVVAQSFYPAWRARVDGNETRVWRANYAFQALEIPPGRHTLLLEYRDRHFTYGAVLSAGTGLFFLVMWKRLGQRESEEQS